MPPTLRVELALKEYTPRPVREPFMYDPQYESPDDMQGGTKYKGWRERGRGRREGGRGGMRW